MNHVTSLPLTPYREATRYLSPGGKRESNPVHPLNASCEPKLHAKVQPKTFTIIPAVKELRLLSQMFQKHMYVRSETTIWNKNSPV